MVPLSVYIILIECFIKYDAVHGSTSMGPVLASVTSRNPIPNKGIESKMAAI